MRTVRISLSLVLAVIVLVFVHDCNGQTSRANPRVVSLETILSCADDSLVTGVFGTDRETATVKLSALLLALQKPENRRANQVDALMKGFVTRAVDIRHLIILPSDLYGHIIKGPLPFCHDGLSAIYSEGAVGSTGPIRMEIDGDRWRLNANELLAHADLFQFSSGVFANSTDVYLIATKGRVGIQFTCSATGLKFYRAFYLPVVLEVPR